MNPVVTNTLEDNEMYMFTLSGVNVCFANAIRRTILTDIPTVAFYTENYKDNDCKFDINSTRLHNEILKQRLSCIPVHVGFKDHDILPKNYVMELDVFNDTDQMIIVTTEHFKIRNKTTNAYLTETETKRLFPPNPVTQMYIDFARVRPKISDTIPGEHLKCTTEFSIRTARESSMFNVVSKCTYFNTLDNAKAKHAWDERAQALIAEGREAEDIQFEKRNFELLDAQRHYLANSFDFIIQTVGVYENKEIVEKAIVILHDKLVQYVELLDADGVNILTSETTMENCFDVVLENEDYTIGKILEFIVYEKYYMGDKSVSFCGFKVFHPHNTSGTLRIAYVAKMDKSQIAQQLRGVCVDATEVFKKLVKYFSK